MPALTRRVFLGLSGWTAGVAALLTRPTPNPHKKPPPTTTTTTMLLPAGGTYRSVYADVYEG
ncbi:MAG TPA: twin-arginine translocation signal domain-containing protein [Streptosporangiaceae bacterium]